jgi:hypothetical protein
MSEGVVDRFGTWLGSAAKHWVMRVGCRALRAAQQRASDWMQVLRLGAEDPVFYWVKSILLLLEASHLERFVRVELGSVVGDGVPMRRSPDRLCMTEFPFAPSLLQRHRSPGLPLSISRLGGA